ncbi:MAG: poly-gamma-glutamate biosynthesis protein [Candidatus Dactylopiibacterium carminicum]|uniref:Poly-gamma-glutamate biosynthesis protein n=1 Tax=Candidatus Dactylopiibacterium carminicum TaxID=857335 RepID=A0A272EWL5_9RHOO|nr:CapA family protein [Candidatus Dactylopiibacterium carminicum]KAF7599245.1 poly-gamma-glutamate biosynthesis protein [Candidatus Dactylopiibacterium carminicum]PAS92796.1 MAG: poly-gamma-glutamate biosynthesis protein [Candidatus Dactylopiibacterium carminicum]PAS94499.1 MAG: poly-gamma-glutamate biosynthesis protein [Candidatus Dactylopiibacterium carminicum]PAS99252.1 MAG: poly-gamma-glutamate biosynthesis protein [Candidatus Dactylopiibacterium carminicum]
MSGRISLGAALAGQFFLLLLALLLPDEARADRSLTLLFAGDVMLDDGPGRLIARGGDPLAPFAAILARADYRIANLETPIAESGRAHPNKIFTFRSRPEVLRVLQGRFDAVSLANNHSGDYGQSAFLETIALLDAQGVGHFGGGRDLAEAHAPLWIVRDGLKIAVLGYNEYKPRSFEAGAGWPGIAWSEDSQVLADIRAARADGADLVIPFMHWGWEGMPLADARAAAVVGGHPHVTQDVEIHRGRPIIYSLGNFVFDGFERREEKTGWLLRLRLDAEGVVAWDTLEARMDADGTPHPVLGARTPCGRRGGREVRACTASDW